MTAAVFILLGLFLCFLGRPLDPVRRPGGRLPRRLAGRRRGRREHQGTTLLVALAGAAGALVLSILLARFALLAAGLVLGGAIGAKLFEVLDQGDQLAAGPDLRPRGRPGLRVPGRAAAQAVPGLGDRRSPAPRWCSPASTGSTPTPPRELRHPDDAARRTDPHGAVGRARPARPDRPGPAAPRRSAAETGQPCPGTARRASLLDIRLRGAREHVPQVVGRFADVRRTPETGHHGGRRPSAPPAPRLRPPAPALGAPRRRGRRRRHAPGRSGRGAARPSA